MKARLLNPMRLAFGPVFQKEVRSAGRRRGTYIARAFTALGLLGVVSFAFVAWAVDSQPGGLARVQSLQSLAPALAMIVVWFQFVVFGFMAPQFSSGAICDERRAQTLSTLLTTPLRPSEIIFGKLSSSVVQLLILALLSVPTLLAVRIFGGLSATFVIGGMAIVLSTAILGASLAVMFSLWSRRASTAGGAALLLLIAVIIGPFIAEALRVSIINRLAGTDFAHFYDNIYATCAPVTLFYLSYSTGMEMEPPSFEFSLGSGGPTVWLGPVWAVNAAYNLGVAMVLLMFASVQLRRTMRRMAGEAPTVASESRRARRRNRKPGQGTPADSPAEELPPAHRHSRNVRGNPVLWREFRQQILGSRRLLGMAALVTVGAMAVLYWQVSIFEEGLHQMMGVIASLAILGHAVAVTTSGIASEREARTWEALIATPMTAGQILWAKFAGGLRSQVFFPAIALAHFAIAAAAGAFWAPAIFHIILIMAGPILFFTATGQLFALIFRRATTAAAVNLTLMLLLYLGPWVLVFVAAALAGFPGSSIADTFYGDVAFAYNPVAMITGTVDRAASEFQSTRIRTSFYLVNATLSVNTYTWLVVGIFCLYAAAAWAVLQFASRWFTRFSGRSS
jgi:ABC-type transport system involved in multi-copper enzyme maturation permease subunit